MGNYINATDISNWPAGMTAAEKEAVITRIELQLEKLTGSHFYAKALDYELNGNGKNRLFLPLEADLISVSNIYICEIEIPVSWYSFDADSVYLDVCQPQSGMGLAEKYYRLGEAAEEGVFVRGYNNIRVVGSYGNVGLLSLAKEACKIMIEAGNDPDLYHKYMKSEKIGDYSYSYPNGHELYTGIRAADDIIDLLVRDKPTLQTP